MKIKKIPMPNMVALFVILMAAMATPVIMDPVPMERDSSGPLWYSLDSEQDGFGPELLFNKLHSIKQNPGKPR